MKRREEEGKQITQLREGKAMSEKELEEKKEALDREKERAEKAEKEKEEIAKKNGEN